MEYNYGNSNNVKQLTNKKCGQFPRIEVQKTNKRGQSNNNHVKIYNKLSNINMTSKDIIKKLSESKVGLINAGGSCYMASIIQILIHTRLFLEQLYNNKSFNNSNSLSNLFLNFIERIANFVDSNIQSMDIKNFANEYNKINNKFRGDKGNNPMTFFTEFINIILRFYFSFNSIK